jgi:hypothetical protein
MKFWEILKLNNEQRRSIRTKREGKRRHKKKQCQKPKEGYLKERMVMRVNHHSIFQWVNTMKRVLNLAMRKGFGALSKLYHLRAKNLSQGQEARFTRR